MKLKTLLVFAAGYAAAEYSLFQQALAGFSEPVQFTITVLVVALVAGSIFDRYYVQPRARRQVRSDG